MGFPKFIVEDNCVIIGKCDYHRRLATDVKNVRGGGWYVMDFNNKTIRFHGDSTDFGKAKVEDIKEAIDNNRVYTNTRRIRSIASKFEFYHNNGVETVELGSYKLTEEDNKEPTVSNVIEALENLEKFDSPTQLDMWVASSDVQDIIEKFKQD